MHVGEWNPSESRGFWVHQAHLCVTCLHACVCVCVSVSANMCMCVCVKINCEKMGAPCLAGLLVWDRHEPFVD